MRLVHAAAVSVAVLLLAGAASAQGLGDAATREKEKRKAAPAKPAKVYTEGDIGPSMAPVSATELPVAPPEGGAAAAKPEGAPGAAGEGAPADAEKTAEEAKAKAEADWRKRLDDARKEEAAHQDLIGRIQLSLNDTSSLYSPSRAANAAQLEETQRKLAESKQRIATLEDEGRRSGYR
jgi:hypothetical protein